MGSVSTVGRVAALGAVIAAVVLVALVLFKPGGDQYTLTAQFINAGQLVKGNPVQTGGTPIGSVGDIQITDDGQAQVKLNIKEKYAPVPSGTRASIRQFSQSGIANRYVDLSYPDRKVGTMDDGARLDVDRTSTAVDLDELFNTLDPPTRKALQGFFKGQARQFRGAGTDANEAFRYLNPALSSTSRLFREATRDQPTLERFLVDSSSLVTTLAERRDDLAGLIGNLNDTTRALGNQKVALASSIERLPPFMRRANTTFVNLRAALNDVDPLVDASYRPARALQPFLTEARAFAADAEPTVRDLRVTVRKPGSVERPDRLRELDPAAGRHRRRPGRAQRQVPPGRLPGDRRRVQGRRARDRRRAALHHRLPGLAGRLLDHRRRLRRPGRLRPRPHLAGREHPRARQPGQERPVPPLSGRRRGGRARRLQRGQRGRGPDAGL